MLKIIVFFSKLFLLQAYLVIRHHWWKSEEGGVNSKEGDWRFFSCWWWWMENKRSVTIFSTRIFTKLFPVTYWCKPAAYCAFQRMWPLQNKSRSTLPTDQARAPALSFFVMVWMNILRNQVHCAHWKIPLFRLDKVPQVMHPDAWWCRLLYSINYIQIKPVLRIMFPVLSIPMEWQYVQELS